MCKNLDLMGKTEERDLFCKWICKNHIATFCIPKTIKKVSLMLLILCERT